jgi:uncharacterized protein YgiM (DUF1202 family)
MKYARLFTWLVLALLFIMPLAVSPSDSDTACTQLVTEALEETNRVCEGAGRNSACYGHPELSARPQSGVDSLDFDTVGDVVNVSQVNSLRLSALDLDSNLWGVALLKLQANIPDENPENLSLLLFGDVQVRNVIETPVLLSGTVNSTGNANIRREPGNDGFVTGVVTRGTEVVLRGRSLDDNWLYLDLPGEGQQRGWIARNLIRSNDDLTQLRIVRPGMTQYGPMQAFYLRTGPSQTTCAEASNDGVLIQTPEGVAEVRLWINEVKIRLGSTAFIQAAADGGMVVKALEGAARVEALGVEQVAVEGEAVTVPLNESLLPSAPPEPAQSFAPTQVNSLPVQALERPITLVPSQTPAPTATTTPTALPPTETNTEIPLPTATPAPTNTPISLPSLTPDPTATATPVPTNTEQPTVPPEPSRPPNTWTPLPPTDTPMPPPTETFTPNPPAGSQDATLTSPTPMETLPSP